VGRGTKSMSVWQRLVHEIKTVGLVAFYFGCWLGALIAIKQLVLAEYHIEFQGMSMALIGALVLSKVVLVLQYCPLGTWVRARPAWVDILLRTVLYSFGVIAVLLLEKGLEGRHEHGGIGPALAALAQHADIYHIWANAIAIGGALLVYNVFAAVRKHLGEGGLVRMLGRPLPDAAGGDRQADR